MSYGSAAALQAAVFQHLSTDPALAGQAIHDAVPPGDLPGTFIAIGPEDVRDRSDKSGQGAEHRFVVSVVSDAAGFQLAKELATTISDRLVDADLTLARGRFIGLGFMRAVARRTTTGRRIDLTFRARVEE